MGKTYFLTGTDTDVGKTIVGCGLLDAARRQQCHTLALKPVSAGCQQTPEGLRNSDALALMAAMTGQLTYEQVNPVAVEPAMAPHIALAQSGRQVTIDRLAGYCRGALLQRFDLALIEGAGGWRVPLNNREMLSELACALQIPVILVVGVRLGCLNHARLTAEAIIRDGLTLAGWIASHPEPVAAGVCDMTLGALRGLLPAPCLGVIPYLASPGREAVAEYLDEAMLLFAPD